MNPLRRRKASIHLRLKTKPTFEIISPTWEAILDTPRPSDSDITPFLLNRTRMDQLLYKKILAFGLRVDPSKICSCGKRETVKHVLYDCISSRMVIRLFSSTIHSALSLSERPILEFADLIYFFPTLRNTQRLDTDQLYKLSVIHSCALDAIWYGRSYREYPIQFSCLSFKTRLQARITIDLSKIPQVEEPLSPIIESHPKRNTSIVSFPESIAPTLDSRRSSVASTSTRSSFSSMYSEASLIIYESPRKCLISPYLYSSDKNK
jgi:hypothetical protein